MRASRTKPENPISCLVILVYGHVSIYRYISLAARNQIFRLISMLYIFWQNEAWSLLAWADNLAFCLCFVTVVNHCSFTFSNQHWIGKMTTKDGAALLWRTLFLISNRSITNLDCGRVFRLYWYCFTGFLFAIRIVQINWFWAVLGIGVIACYFQQNV